MSVYFLLGLSARRIQFHWTGQITENKDWLTHTSFLSFSIIPAHTVKDKKNAGIIKKKNKRSVKELWRASVEDVDLARHYFLFSDSPRLYVFTHNLENHEQENKFLYWQGVRSYGVSVQRLSLKNGRWDHAVQSFFSLTYIFLFPTIIRSLVRDGGRQEKVSVKDWLTFLSYLFIIWPSIKK